MDIKRGSDAWPETDERPVWLDDNDTVWLTGKSGKSWGPYIAGNVPASDIKYSQAIAVRLLPDDHWANRAIAAGFVPWSGDSAPADWDNTQPVLLQDGHEIVGSTWCWSLIYSNPRRIIGYRRRKSTVSIEMRTEAEARAEWNATMHNLDGASSDSFIAWLMSYGIIAPPPTRLERFMVAHPTADRRTAELAMEWPND